jgi:hypothetical protein
METRSRFIESNGSGVRCLDRDGNPLQGEVITGEGVILRFIDGLLDGDRTAGRGAVTLPAVEAPGHLEWWREGRLHRDGGLPAVMADDFETHEWWDQGRKA